MSDSEQDFYESESEMGDVSDIEGGEEEGKEMEEEDVAGEEGGEEVGDEGDEGDEDEGEDGDDEEDEDDEGDEGEEEGTKPKKKANIPVGDDEEEEEDDTTQESFMFKVDDMDTIYRKAEVTYNEDGRITDSNHKTTPFMTKYEYTKIISTRMKMIVNGSRPFVPVKVGDSVKEIVQNELKERRIPFIIRRPIPNGTFEYWRVKDLIPYEA